MRTTANYFLNFYANNYLLYFSINYAQAGDSTDINSKTLAKFSDFQPEKKHLLSLRQKA